MPEEAWFSDNLDGRDWEVGPDLLSQEIEDWGVYPGVLPVYLS